MNRSVLDSIHESAKDLHQAGVVPDVTLREFDALCLPPVKQYTPAPIKRSRQKTRTNECEAPAAASFQTPRP